MRVESINYQLLFAKLKAPSSWELIHYEFENKPYHKYPMLYIRNLSYYSDFRPCHKQTDMLLIMH